VLAQRCIFKIVLKEKEKLGKTQRNYNNELVKLLRTHTHNIIVGLILDKFKSFKITHIFLTNVTQQNISQMTNHLLKKEKKNYNINHKVWFLFFKILLIFKNKKKSIWYHVFDKCFLKINF